MKTIQLPDELHLSLIAQVNMTGCMTRRVYRTNMKVMNKEGDPPTTIQHRVLEYGVGRYCIANKWTGIHRGPMKNCYSNAARLVLTDPDRFIYMEGYGCRPELGLVVGEHAWVLDKERGYEVIDPTWRNTQGAAYLGIPFSFDYQRQQILEHKIFGMLDTPWSRWPVRRLPASNWLHPDADKLPRDFTVPTDLTDPTTAFDELGA